MDSVLKVGLLSFLLTFGGCVTHTLRSAASIPEAQRSTIDIRASRGISIDTIRVDGEQLSMLSDTVAVGPGQHSVEIGVQESFTDEELRNSPYGIPSRGYCSATLTTKEALLYLITIERKGGYTELRVSAKGYFEMLEREEPKPGYGSCNLESIF